MCDHCKLETKILNLILKLNFAACTLRLIILFSSLDKILIGDHLSLIIVSMLFVFLKSFQIDIIPLECAREDKK